jgi:hypothetical protein
MILGELTAGTYLFLANFESQVIPPSAGYDSTMLKSGFPVALLKGHFKSVALTPRNYEIVEQVLRVEMPCNTLM